jgi:2'-5' RNA ligase
MSGLPVEMVDRWQDRAEPAASEGLIYWHMLVGADPDVHSLAEEAQRRLAPFPGLHLAPLEWLHMTALIAGPASEINGDQVGQMAAAASRILAEVPPITVTIGKVLYHEEAIMLAARPPEALVPVRDAVKEATRRVMGSPGRSGSKLASWTPHVTIAYSTTRQPAEPIIRALGMSLPERKVTIGAVSLVDQRGAERSWDWQSLAVIRLGTGLNTESGDGWHRSSLSAEHASIVRARGLSRASIRRTVLVSGPSHARTARSVSVGQRGLVVTARTEGSDLCSDRVVSLRCRS